MLTEDKVDVLDRTRLDRLFVDADSPWLAVGDEGVPLSRSIQIVRMVEVSAV